MNNDKISYTGLPGKIIFSPVLYLVFRAVLGGIFIYSGSVKLMDTYKFAKVLYEYGILPDFLINPAAAGLPLVEIAAGLGLILNLKYSLETITLMLLMFIGVLWFGILNNLNIDCGCFSSEQISEHGNLQKALYRDFVFIAISIFLFLNRYVNKTSRPQYLFPRLR